jgi:hypothetical protein
MDVDFTFGIPPFTFTVSAREIASLVKRFTEKPLLSGPCLILNRAYGLALDATTARAAGTRTTLWGAHAGPHQQWRVEKAGRDLVEIISDPTGLRLTTAAGPQEWGSVWLDDARGSGFSSRWRLRETPDRVAFIIESESGSILDGGIDARANAEPHVSRTDRDPWQQWIIARLPLGPAQARLARGRWGWCCGMASVS